MIEKFGTKILKHQLSKIFFWSKIIFEDRSLKSIKLKKIYVRDVQKLNPYESNRCGYYEIAVEIVQKRVPLPKGSKQQSVLYGRSACQKPVQSPFNGLSSKNAFTKRAHRFTRDFFKDRKK